MRHPENEGLVRLAADPEGRWSLLRGARAYGVDALLLVPGDAEEPRVSDRSAVGTPEHPRVARILGEERIDGVGSLLLPDPGGPSLAEQRLQPLPWSVVLAIAEDAASALGAIHAAGRAHGNVGREAFVLDVAERRAILVDVSPLLCTTAPARRPAPELAPGDAATPGGDLHALGELLYALLVGRGPFESADPLERRRLLLAGQPPPPHLVMPDVPEGFSDIVLRLLRKDPGERYPSAAALVADLSRARALLAADDPPILQARTWASPRIRWSGGVAGRVAERTVLLDALARVAAGNAHTVTVTAPAGGGKTTLIEQLRRPTLDRGGCFGIGRTDPLGAPRPLGALAGALDEIAAQILAGDATRLEAARRAVVREVGGNGPLLASLAPRLRGLVRETGGSPSDEGVAAAAARLSDALERLVVALADAAGPIVLALDDLQRADPETLAFLHALLDAPEARRLLIVAAWRDDEPGAPASLAEPAPGRTALPLHGLTTAELRVLLDEVLGPCVPVGGGDDLAQLVRSRTGGNPFFVHVFLEELVAKGAVRRAPGAPAWEVDLALARATDASEGVAALVARQLRALPEPVREALAVGARLGDTFEEDLLSRCLGVADIGARLEAAADTGAVARVPGSAPPAWRFLHDRLHQAALDLTPPAAAPALHARIGALLDAALGPSPDPAALLRAVHQLDLGADALVDPAEHQRLAMRNRDAAAAARAAGSFGGALRFAETGLRLVDPASRPLVVSLHLEAARAALIARPEAVDAHIDAVLAADPDPLDAAGALELRIDGHIVRYEAAAALAATRAAVAPLGYVLPETAGLGAVALALARAKLAMIGRGPDQIAGLPEVRDPRQSALLRVLLRACTAAYLADADYFAFLCCEMVRLGLAAGACPGTAWALLVYAILQSAAFGDIEGGFRLGEAALAMLDRFAPHGLGAKANSVWLATQLHNRRPLRETLGPLSDGIRIGLAEGDPLHAGINGAFYLQHLVFAGGRLERVSAEYDRVIADMERRGNTVALETLEPFVLLLRALRGMVDADALLAAPSAAGDKPYKVFTFGLCRAVLALVLGRDAEALAHATMPFAVLAAGRGTVNEALHQFFEGVAAGRLALGAAGMERWRLARRLRSCLAAMRRRAGFNPADYEARVALLEGLDAAVRRDVGSALRAFDHAAERAAAADRLIEVAIARECASNLHETVGATDTARLLRAAAAGAWSEWGARAGLGSGASPPSIRPSSREPMGPSPSVEVVVRATESLAGNVGRDALLLSIVRLTAMQAGAERVVMLATRGEGFVVRAVLEGDSVRLGGGVPLEVWARATGSAARLAARTGEVVLVRDAAREAFGTDPWVRSAGVRSVLALPVFLRGALCGVLLLEHTHRTGAFTHRDVPPLRVLTTVAAALLENAELVTALEARAEELRVANRTLDDHRRALEEAVRARTGELDALSRLQASVLDALSEGVCGLDADGAVTFANAAAGRLLGLAPAAIVGRRFHDSFHGADPCAVCAATEMCQDVATTLRTDAGAALWVECAVQPLHEEGRLVGRVLSFRDISRRRELEEALRHSARMEAVGRFVGGVAHEFNNLLVPILGRLEQAQQSPRLDAELRAELHAAQRAGYRAADLVRQLLSLGRRSVIERRPVDLVPTLDDALRLVRPSIDRRVSLLLRAPEEGCWALADTGQVHQVVLNLCLNARDALREPESQREPRIFVTVLRRELDAAAASGHPRARPGTWVEMSVEDNGPGIPPDVLAAMWDPFYSTKPVGTGSGLGLSVVAGIVEQHGGWIAVESTLGVGTVFRCYFPASTPAPVEAGPATPIPTAPPATGRRILLVDDEALVRDVAREMLERAGYDVIECPDGDTAIATLEAGVRPAVVLLDLTMPGLDGWQTLATIRRLTPDLPVVILSGHDPHLSGSGPGADAPEGRVAKPFSRKDLVEAVQRAVRDGRNSAGPSSVGPA